jgi:hypothetical protein
MRTFRLTTRATLPRLAWCARVGKGKQEVGVDCGPWVEGNAGFFCEGAWSGSFERNDFPEALTFTGTGAVTRGDRLVFCAPTDTLQGLYSLRLGDSILCSNSMAFLLQQAGDGIDGRYLYYDFDMMSIMDGLRDCRKHVPTRAGNRVHMHYHCNLAITPQLEIFEHAKTLPPEFADFGTYHAFLQDQVAAVTRNASDPARRVRYALLSTISSGYDSPAAAVLGKAAGCAEAVTFRSARTGEDDSGQQIGEFLGLAVTEYDSEAYLQRAGSPEAEFVATGHGGDDVVMSVLEEALPNRLLLSGYHGDKIWARDAEPTPYIVRGDPSGASLGEFRLRVGFLNLPVPFVGCTRHASIRKISNSPEMHPWSIGDVQYDRPIPRRIVENAGVPRRLFGQRKKAIARPYQTTGPRNPELSRVLSPDSNEQFGRFAEGRALFGNLLECLGFAMMHHLYRFNFRVIRSVKLNALTKALGLMMPEKAIVPLKYSKPRTRHSLVFHWGYARIRARYRFDVADASSPSGCVNSK